MVNKESWEMECIVVASGITGAEVRDGNNKLQIFMLLQLRFFFGYLYFYE